MEYIKKFSTLKELKRSKEFKEKDLSYCDVSGIDLSALSWREWCGFKFFHTNFKDTNIKFEPSSLKQINYHYCLEYCDFTGCDLSNIKSFAYVSFKGSIFKGTHLSVRLLASEFDDVKDVVFSEEMADQVRKLSSVGVFDISTLKLNPHIPFSSLEIFLILRQLLPSIKSFIASHSYEKYLTMIKETLVEDAKREGALCRLCTILGYDKFSPIDKIQLFQGLIHDKCYDEIDFSSIPHDLLEKFRFVNCRFKELTLPFGEMEELSMMDKTDKTRKLTIIPHVIIPGLDASSWQSKRKTRLGNTCITRQTNLYLELGRKCNGRCSFCRNHLLEPTAFNFDAVMKSFRSIEPYLNNIVIGGGEPTLKETRELLTYIRNHKKNYGVGYYVSTNGSCGPEYLWELVSRLQYYVNISRHSIEDADNNQILGVKSLSTEEIRDLTSKYYTSAFTLVATCFQEGLNSVEALERYIELSDYLRIRNVLFQSLHEDMGDLPEKLRKLHQIDDMIFDEVIAKLREQNYFVSELPIYSTGDYKLIIVKSSDGDKTISFKKYITKEELDREWPRASKRSFDLSIAPNGDIFQNWHQKSDKVLCNLTIDEQKRQ